MKRPLNLGGLGIVDLERFAIALRLRWLWFEWKNQERAWVGLDIPCSKVDRDLFHASTVVTVGNGVKANEVVKLLQNAPDRRFPNHLGSKAALDTQHL